MTNNSHSPQHTAIAETSLDPFEVAMDALRSVGVGFEIVGEFNAIGTGPDSFERAA